MSITFDAAELTAAEAAGDACVVCGRYFATAGVPSTRVGMVDGTRVSACSSHLDPDAVERVLAAEILDDAADVIERNGLYYGGWVNVLPGRSESECPVCTGGAMNLAALGLAEIDADDEASLRGAHRRAYLALARRLDPDVVDTTEDLVDTVARWNDHRRPPAGEVVAELRAAAEDERGAS